MPVRIYALAKELKLDSKELVEICEQAGVPGKGSALASLSDEEAEKVKAFFSGKSQPAVETPPKEEKKAAPAEPRPAKKDVKEVIRREDYIAPGGGSGKMRSLDARTEKQTEAKKKPASDAGRPAAKSGPQIKLAPMPTAAQPSVEAPTDNEPAPQKPDLKLPVDAIRAGKMGSKPLSEHIRQHDEKRKAEAGKSPKEKVKPGVRKEADDDKSLSRRDKRRKGIKSGEGEDDVAATRASRLLGRRRPAARRRADDDDGSHSYRRRSQLKRSGTNTAAPRKGKIAVELPCTVSEFSETAGVPVASILRQLLKMSIVAQKNAVLDEETAQLLALELGVELEFKHEQALEDQLLTPLEELDDDPASLKPRPPVVTFLGHVDHGKTSLLDHIIGTNVVSKETGGITQHIRAYQIMKDDRAISFVDTPGHEAFTQMRARGATVTDIVVLVVAADDGVMPQTEEAISHAKAAGVPIVVALNKIDLPAANPQRAFEQLAARELLPSEWGGDTEVVKTSAISGEGMDELLDTLVTIAELHDYKANPDRDGIGTCLEAELHEGRGTVCKLIVQSGTLRVGDVVVCGSSYGRVKAMYDTLRPTQTLEEAGPATPVNVTGLNTAPGAGDPFYVLKDVAQARNIAESRAATSRQTALSGRPVHVTLENLFDRLQGAETQTLNLVLKGDTQGSIEAIHKEFTKLENPEIKLRVLHQGVGGVTEGDVALADASDAIVIAFNVVPDESARSSADDLGVQIRQYGIIYRLTEELKAAMEGMLKPEERESDLGRALVQRLFVVGRVGTIAGCRVVSGTIQRNSRIRVVRDSRIIGDYALESLRREKDDTREVREGYECGMKLAGFNDLKEGDILEAYTVEEVARELETVS